MQAAMIDIRPERPSDAASIDTITLAAFRNAPHSGHTEHAIVRALRAADALAVSLVAEGEAGIIGHVAASSVAISDGTAHWYGLGPISVLPSHQCTGIGSRLMSAALVALRARDAGGCVVLGDPAYYARFGFSACPDLRFPGVPPVFFQALCFRQPQASGIVTYHPAFYPAN